MSNHEPNPPQTQPDELPATLAVDPDIAIAVSLAEMEAMRLQLALTLAQMPVVPQTDTLRDLSPLGR
jgi:hypothetical protein